MHRLNHEPLPLQPETQVIAPRSEEEGRFEGWREEVVGRREGVEGEEAV